MIAALAVALAGAATPAAVTIVTPAGERRIPVVADPSQGQLVPAGITLAALGATSSTDGIWAEVRVGEMPFRFLLGGRLYAVAERVFPLASMATVRRDTLFLPLEFLSDALPRHQAGRFRWDPRLARLVDAGAPPQAVRAAVGSATPETPRSADTGPLRLAHRVTIDPGHGGVDPGNPGLYFPRGIREKDVTLEIALLVRAELRRQGVEVTMTRTTDTLIDLGRRSGYCRNDCDLFVSLHVNSLARRAGYTAVNGFETYILGEARTEDAARVARMENEAIRFEQASGETQAAGLDFILKDLQLNEHLRESARAAQLIQSHVQRMHPGEDKGVKQTSLMVLNTAKRPAVLFEMGFSTNRRDARVMTDGPSQRRLAKAVADAIVSYLAEFERRTDAAASTAGTRGRE